jgi:hypothetical protein
MFSGVPRNSYFRVKKVQKFPSKSDLFLFQIVGEPKNLTNHFTDQCAMIILKKFEFPPSYTETMMILKKCHIVTKYSVSIN